VEVYISDTREQIRVNSLNIEDGIEEHSTASFVVRDLHGIKNFQEGQPVRIQRPNGVVEFLGFIAEAEKVPLTHGQIACEWDIVCSDLHYLAQKRVVALSKQGTTAGEVVNEITRNYLVAEGVTNTLKYWDDYSGVRWEEL